MSDADDDLSLPDLARPTPPPTWRERLDRVRGRYSTGQLVAAVLLTVGALVAALVVLRPGPAPAATELDLPRASASSASPGPASPSTTAAPALDVVVDAAGAFVHPGLYRLPRGSRVDDLVAAAGGLAPEADDARLNRAALLTDGEQVVALRRGDPAPAAPSGASAAGPIDLNTATVDQLDALPGIGPATAQAIVAERERHGPFRSVDDLQRVRGIGPAKVDALRGLVTV